MADTSPKLSILVVEDESLLRMDAVDMLEEAGYHVIEAATGEEGAAKLDNDTPLAGLLTDVQMPGAIDGLALARITHEMHPNAVILVVSGRIRPTTEQLPPGATFLGKPYSGRAVLQLLDRMVGQSPT
jgi:two-component system, response regulator PdtaR